MLVAQLCPTLCDLYGWQHTRLLCQWNSSGKIAELVAAPSLGDPVHPGNEPRSPTSQADVFAFEPPMDDGYMRTIISCFSVKLLLWHKEHDH